MKTQLTDEQLKAYKILESGKNVFLSGYAGTGKSFLLNYFIKKMEEDGKAVVTAAPTGIAAINIGGTTLHRLLHLKADTNLTEATPKYIEELAQADIFIVDEISMCRSDLFELTVETVNEANSYRYDKHLPSIQFIVVGDFCQLPPVVAGSAEKEYFAGGQEFAFRTTEWRNCNFTNVFLKTVIRQKDTAFTQALNQVRLGEPTGLDYINSHSSKKRLSKAITLCGTNRTAEDINHKRLSKLKDKSATFYAEIKGKVIHSDRPNTNQVTLKKGALVVFLTNAKNGKYQNGTTGTIENFLYDIDDEEEIIGVVVKLEDGNTVGVIPYTWKIYGYKIEKIPQTKAKRLKKVEIGSFTQMPLKLAYAVTIHKSQGQTYDAINFDPEVWASGQLYVALSRVKSLSKLYLKKPLTPSMVILDKHVKDFYQKIESSQVKGVNIAAELPSQHEKRQKNTTTTAKGGRRKGAGRKKSVPGMQSTAIRIPKLLADPLKEIKSLGADDVKEAAEMLKIFVQMHKKK